jgi:hypothetical protein
MSKGKLSTPLFPLKNTLHSYNKMNTQYNAILFATDFITDTVSRLSHVKEPSQTLLELFAETEKKGSGRSIDLVAYWPESRLKDSYNERIKLLHKTLDDIIHDIELFSEYLVKHESILTPEVANAFAVIVDSITANARELKTKLVEKQ